MSKKKRKEEKEWKTLKWALPIRAFNYMIWRQQGRYLTKEQSKYLREEMKKLRR